MRYAVKEKITRVFVALILSSLLLNISFNSAYGVESEYSISQEEFYDELTIMMESGDDYDSNIEIESTKDGETVIESKISTNRLIVSTESNNPLSKNYGAVSRIEGYNNWHIFQYKTYEEASLAYEAFSQSDNISFVEFDELIEFDDTEIGPSNNENYEPLSWGAGCVQSITANEAIKDSEIELPEVVVAIIDTGVDSNHRYFNSDFGNSRILNGNRSNDNIAYKDHGTHVAGIVVDNTLSNVKIKSYNFFYYQGKKVAGTFVSLATEINSAVKDGVDVINLSLGGWSILSKSDSIEGEIQDAVKNSIPVVVSAGNEFTDASLIFPANDPNVITVSAVDDKGEPAVFSNFGNKVDIAAPGVNINSTMPSNATSDNNYGLMSGTSMAAPFVSAAVAMMKTIYPTLTVAEIKEKLIDSSVTPQGWSGLYGKGIINFENIIKNDRIPYPIINLGKNGATITSSDPNAIIIYTTDGSTPSRGNGKIYSSELINTTNIDMIKAIAYKEGHLPSYEIIKRLKFLVNATVRYKGSIQLPYIPDSKIIKCYSLNPDIVTVDYNGNINGISVGKAKIIVYFENNQVGTYNVTVEYAWWQWLIRIIFWGFLWY